MPCPNGFFDRQGTVAYFAGFSATICLSSSTVAAYNYYLFSKCALGAWLHSLHTHVARFFTLGVTKRFICRIVTFCSAGKASASRISFNDIVAFDDVVTTLLLVRFEVSGF
jgi:hypothetical protein